MPTRTRALVGTFMGYCYTLGQFLLAGVSYAVPAWRWLQLTVSLPFFCFFLYSWRGGGGGGGGGRQSAGAERVSLTAKG